MERGKKSFSSVVVTGVLIALLAVLVCGFAGTQTAHGDTGTGYTTDSFDVKVRVNKDYTYDYTETITVDFQEARHGIYRDIPMDASYRVLNIRVSGAPYEVEKQDGHQVIRIGDADSYVTGRKTYTVKYTIACIEKSGASNDIYTDLLPTGWQTDIGHASVTVTLPSDLKLGEDDIKTYVGAYGSTGQEYGTWNYDLENHRITYEAYGLPEGAGATIRASVPEGYWKGAMDLEWTSRLAIGVIAAALCAMLFMRLRWGREPQFAEPVEFYSPEGLDPVEVGCLIDGNVDRKDVTAMFFYLASKGYLKIKEKSKKDYEFIKAADVPEKESKNVKTFFRGIFGKKASSREIGYTVGMEDAGKRLASAYDQVKTMTEDSFSGSRSIYSHESKVASVVGTALYGAVVFLLTLLALYREGGLQTSIFMSLGSDLICSGILTWLMLKFRKVNEYRFSRSGASTVSRLVAWGIVYFVAGTIFAALIGSDKLGETDQKAAMALYIFLIVAPVLMVGMRSRTEWSARMLGRIKGFRNFIRDAELPKLNELVEQDPDYFYNILPYAYVLGLTKKWAKNFESISMEEPDWYLPYGAGSDRVFDAMVMNSMVSSFSASAGNVVISHDSGGGSWGDGFSGGGGGGFSGGGSGGGGGGAW